MAINIEELKQSLTLDDIEKILKTLGGNPIRKNDYIICDTICHNLPNEGSHKLYYYDNTKLFKCYTQCGDYFDILELIIKAKNLQTNENYNLSESIKWLTELINYDNVDFDFVETKNQLVEHYINLIETYNNKLQSLNNEKVLNKYDDRILNNLDILPIETWEQEGITYEILQKFNIRYYPKDCKIVIPHYDINNNLIGIRGRTLIQEEGELYGKYMPLKINGTLYTHPLSFNLYGINWNSENIKRSRMAILFEGEKSVMKYEKLFGANNNISLATCGLNFTQQQFDLLLKLGVKDIVVAFDKQYNKISDDDIEWLKMRKLYESLYNKFGNYINISFVIDKNNLLNYKDSPIDKDKETFLILFKERVFL